MGTMLFFDDTRLYLRENLTREYGKPELEQIMHCENPNWFFNWPLGHWQEPDGTWYMPMLLIAKNTYGIVKQNEGTEYAVALFKSCDGENWEPVNRAEEFGFENPVVPNQCMTSEKGEEPAYIFYDKEDVPERRYKLLSIKIDNTRHWVDDVVYCSENCFQWRLMDGAFWSCRGAEPGLSVFRIEEKHTNALACRPTWGDRRICISTTDNFNSFTQPQIKVQPDSIDPPQLEFYGMRVNPYKGHYIGFLWQYHTLPTTENKFRGGNMDCQLTYSLNGLDWFRSLRVPFIANGEKGTFNAGMLFASDVIQVADGSLRLYVTVFPQEHPDYAVNGSLAKYKLREDGFIKLVAGNEEGLISTRPILLKGGFDVNLKCESPATCEIRPWHGKEPFPGFSHADCVPFKGDSTHWVPQWKEHDISELKNTPICMQIKFANGELYAINGDVTPITVHEAIHYNRRGTTLDTRGY